MIGRLFAHLRRQWIGVLALLLVLTGGTAYALDGSNTVFSDDIVNKQVRQIDLKPAETWHEVGTPGEPAFRSSDYPVVLRFWTNYDSGHNSAAFYRDPYGRVHLKGLVRASGSDGDGSGMDDIFQLPAGYTPAKEIEFATSSEGGFARLDVKPDGTVSADPPFNWGSLYLDNIQFRCFPSGQNGCP